LHTTAAAICNGSDDDVDKDICLIVVDLKCGKTHLIDGGAREGWHLIDIIMNEIKMRQNPNVDMNSR
jgi:hypothetical protein